MNNNYLILFVVVCGVCACASAQEGSCGSRVTWTFDASTGTLHLTGEGWMSSRCNVSDEIQSLVKTVVVHEGITSVGNSAFMDWTEMTSFFIADSVTKIEQRAFVRCYSLSSVAFGQNLRTIESRAFDSCGSLTTVSIPDSVTSIQWAAFSNCSRLTTFKVSDKNAQFATLDGVLFDKNITTLVQYPCGKKDRFVVPSSVTEIDGGAFDHCMDLTEINVDRSNSFYSSYDGVLFDKNMTKLVLFPYSKEGSFTIPDTVKRIGDSAFYDSQKLTKLIIPDSVEYFGMNTFWGSRLTSVIIGNGMKSIPESSFYDCNFLETVIFSPSLTEINECAFQRCSSLTRLDIPSSVSSIGRNAFDNNTNLELVSYKGVTDPGNDPIGSFNFCPKLAAVCVPSDYESDSFCGQNNLAPLSKCDVSKF